MKLNRLEFKEEGFDGGTTGGITPYIDGKSLIQLITDYENSALMDSAGEYGPVAIGWFWNHNHHDYWYGLGSFPAPDRIWLLGCDCGDIGDRPLEVTVEASSKTVIWKDFRYPNRPNRRYRFGPFVFSKQHYDQATSELVNFFST
ncbi:hypothetical protein [Psychromicrobium lacuslunae]|uniref:hypothetical protein n=1 Tax=Psychromicrobium lacuslunae TaxID=1618207 RepID=UPI0006984F17|nr:hypothetical protein [Psychromicrobium lacuslunae]